MSEEKLYRNTATVITRGYNEEDAEENLKKGVLFLDETLEYWEEETLSHLDHDPELKEKVAKRIWRRLKND